MRLAILFIVIFCAPAFATLGERENSVANRSKKTTFQFYTRHESVVPKATVREFSDGNGRIFAVTWRGKSHPDLTALLGSHLPEYQAAVKEARKVRRGHSPIEIEFGNMHVEMGGVGRSFYGRVWLLNQVPERVNTGDIN